MGHLNFEMELWLASLPPTSLALGEQPTGPQSPCYLGSPLLYRSMCWAAAPPAGPSWILSSLVPTYPVRQMSHSDLLTWNASGKLHLCSWPQRLDYACLLTDLPDIQSLTLIPHACSPKIKELKLLNTIYEAPCA